jgi:hypothetical protein
MSKCLNHATNGISKFIAHKHLLRSEENVKNTSDVRMMNRDVIIGNMQKASGVVRSVNQNAPPPFRDGTFSTMFDI